MSEKIPIQTSSGNVFADLGIEDADDYLAKSELAAYIQTIIESRGLSQSAAGRLLGVGQPKVSKLLNGRLDGFSTDRLFSFLNKLGCDIQIKVSKPRAGATGQVLDAPDISAGENRGFGRCAHVRYSLKPNGPIHGKLGAGWQWVKRDPAYAVSFAGPG